MTGRRRVGTEAAEKSEKGYQERLEDWVEGVQKG